MDTHRQAARCFLYRCFSVADAAAGLETLCGCSTLDV